MTVLVEILPLWWASTTTCSETCSSAVLKLTGVIPEQQTRSKICPLLWVRKSTYCQMSKQSSRWSVIYCNNNGCRSTDLDIQQFKRRSIRHSDTRQCKTTSSPGRLTDKNKPWRNCLIQMQKKSLFCCQVSIRHKTPILWSTIRSFVCKRSYVI